MNAEDAAIAAEVRVELADARAWLVGKKGRGASVVIYDPPYATGTPGRI